MKHSILKKGEVYISRWLKLHSKGINAKGANTNGFQETIMKHQESARNAKAHIGTSQGRNSSAGIGVGGRL
jgi:hypothetical protein